MIGYFGEENSVVKIKDDELISILVATKSQDTTSVTSNDEQMFVNLIYCNDLMVIQSWWYIKSYFFNFLVFIIALKLTNKIQKQSKLFISN